MNVKIVRLFMILIVSNFAFIGIIDNQAFFGVFENQTAYACSVGDSTCCTGGCPGSTCDQCPNYPPTECYIAPYCQSCNCGGGSCGACGCCVDGCTATLNEDGEVEFLYANITNASNIANLVNPVKTTKYQESDKYIQTNSCSGGFIPTAEASVTRSVLDSSTELTFFERGVRGVQSILNGMVEFWYFSLFFITGIGYIGYQTFRPKQRGN